MKGKHCQNLICAGSVKVTCSIRLEYFFMIKNKKKLSTNQKNSINLFFVILAFF